MPRYQIPALELLLNNLKGQVSTLSLLSVLLMVALVLYITRRRRSAMVAFVTGCVCFVLASTAYLPRYLVGRLEAQYPPFAFSTDDDSSEVVTIHVLGGGYTYDPRLPELAQLSPPSAGRLAEGLRISRYFRNSRLVFSGWRVSGPESMAMVMKVAAESLGAEPSHISLLEDARTTQQEARDLALMYGTNLDLILVTDAVHMPRAMRLFEAEGFRPHAAPANFLVHKNDDDLQFKWVPSGRNIQLMDRALREFLGNVKAMVLGGESTVHGPQSTVHGRVELLCQGWALVEAWGTVWEGVHSP